MTLIDYFWDWFNVCPEVFNPDEWYETELDCFVED